MRVHVLNKHAEINKKRFRVINLKKVQFVRLHNTQKKLIENIKHKKTLIENIN